jgi:glyoxylase-like metal-dependent hydrolase (beta-lactamase superfamily II)
VKALNNYLSAVALAATAEAMMAGESFGIEPRLMLEILNHSTGRNTATEQKYPAFVLPRTFDSGFALGLMAKDLRIALALAEAVGTPKALLSEGAGLWAAPSVAWAATRTTPTSCDTWKPRGEPTPMSEPLPYELYALRYATATRNPADVFIGADPHDAAVPMDYFVWAARNELHTVVIDTGFGVEAAQRRGRQLLREPGDALRLLGIDCADVKHVIITHLHYDHAGNLQLFPRARFHLQESEMAFATGRHMAHAFFAHAYDLEAVLSMVRLVYGAQVQFHHGDAEIVPGSRCITSATPMACRWCASGRVLGRWSLPPMPRTTWPT